MITPKDLEKKYESLEKAISSTLARQKLWLLEIIFGLGALGIYFLLLPLWKAQYPLWSKLFLFQEKKTLFTILIAFSLITPKIPRKWLTQYAFLALSIAWAYALYEQMGWCWSQSIMPILILLAGFALKLSSCGRWGKIFSGFFFIAVFIGATYQMGLDAIETKSPKGMRIFWSTHPEFFLVFVLFWCWIIHMKEKVSMAFCPTNSLYGMIWPEESLAPKNSDYEIKPLWWRGFLNLAVGFICITLAMALISITRGQAEKSFLWGTLLVYSNFILLVTGGMNLATAVARMYGFSVPDATHFLALAKTPLEVWQRGAVYVYQFVFRHIFLPTFRWSRKLSITAIACFLIIVFHIFIFHDVIVRNLYRLLLPKMPSPNYNVILIFLNSVSWVAGWTLLIFLTIFVWNKILHHRPSAIRDWASVLVNHLFIAYLFNGIQLYFFPWLVSLL